MINIYMRYKPKKTSFFVTQFRGTCHMLENQTMKSNHSTTMKTNTIAQNMRNN